jgi:t-SNARE complex subunit (syntaxin)
MNEKEKQTDILNNINNQFKEVIDLIEKEKDLSFSIKSFEKKKKSKKRWFIICFLLLLSISICFILSNDELTYNIYFLFLSFIRLILIKVRRI